MNEIKIQLIQAEILQGALAGCAHILWSVIGIPQFRGHPELFATHEALR